MLTRADLHAAVMSTLGGGASPVKPGLNDYEFAKANNLRIDGHPMTGAGGLDGAWRHLRDVYEDTHRKLVVMASAQSGKSARLMVHMLRTALGTAYGQLVGYYFPDKHLPLAFSSSRWKPMLKSNPVIGRLLGAPRTEGQRGQDSILTMTLGETTLYFLTIGGKTATEGLPLKAVYFDEVRRMDIGDIERAQERYSAQTDPIDVKVSTARYPDTDIDLFFKQGDQRYFHTACDCADGVVLSTTFPDCIADLRNVTPAFKRKVDHAFRQAGVEHYGVRSSELGQWPSAVYVCPTCGTVIPDPREGWWEPHAPNNWIHSYQLPQMLSPVWPAGRMLHAWENHKDEQEFYNSKLGLPFVDRRRMPVQPEHVNACVDTELKWAAHLTPDQRQRRMVNTAMGVDVQYGYGIVVIKQRAPNGKFRTVHLEVARPPGGTGTRTWWDRLGQLMSEYQVSLAVIDEAPEYSQSSAFTRHFHGRAYILNYGLSEKSPQAVSWPDEALEKDKKQKGKETEIRYRVSIDRTRALHWSLMRWRHRQNELPNIDSLLQTLPLQNGEPVFSSELRIGTEGPARLGHVYRNDMCRWVFRDLKEDAPSSGKRHVDPATIGVTKMVAEWIGGHSPDFAFADLFANLALDRLGKPFGVRRLG